MRCQDCNLANPPVVLVVLAAFNGAQWIGAQIDSILSQHGVQVSLWISVDFSQDETEAIVAQLAEDDGRIHVLPCGEKFGGAARNFYRLLRDVNLNAVQYLAFADQDDIWHPEKLLRACSYLSKQGYSAYSGNVVAFWSDGRKKLVNKSQPQKLYDYLFEAAGPGSTYVFERSLALTLQEFVLLNWEAVDQVALHDWLFYAFARSHNYRWFIDSYPAVMYRQHDHNQLGVNLGIMALTDRIKRIGSGWYYGEIVKIALLCGAGNGAFVKGLLQGKAQARWIILRDIGQCRRRTIDRLFLLLCCIVGLI